MQALSQLFSLKDLIPHGYCLAWSPLLLWLSVISDGLITLSYYFIPLAMIYFLRQRKTLPYPGLLVLFAAFIVACGTTHLLSAITIWIPLYWLDVVFKVITALLSVATAIAILRMLPNALKIPTISEYQSEIQARLDVEAALWNSEKKFNFILDNIPAQVFIKDLDFKYQYVNHAVLDYFAADKDKIIGSTNERFLDESTRLVLEQNDRETLKTRQAKAMEIVDTKNQRTFLTYKHPLISENGLIYGLCGIWLDITERKQAETQLNFNDIALNAINQTVIITDKAQNVIWVNKAFEDLTGYSQAEVLGKNCRILQGPLSDPETIKVMRIALKNKQLFHDQILNYRKDGSPFWKELTIFPIFNAQGELTNYISISRDLKEQKQAELALLKGREQAEQANLAKSQFLAMMSHEIRTPLNVILGMQELLLTTRLEQQQSDYVKTATEAGVLLLDLINDILDLTKVESGKLELELVAFDTAALVEVCMKLMSIKAAEKGLVLHTVIEPDVNTWINGDPLRFRQVLLNLLSNAIKFTENGSITVKLSTQPATDNDQALLLEVIDTGIGIATDVQPKLFEVFTQADPSDTRKYGGSGLGLAISKRLVELWGGKIGIDSTPAVGTRFWFTVGTEAKPMPMPMPMPTANLSANILLVEDSLLNQAVMVAMLRSAGHQVDLADCGTKGIEAASEKDYDIILMDISMPDMSGMEATAIIRQLGGTATTVPIIAITAHALAGYEAMCLAAGMNGYATKPISQKDLLALVTKWCVTTAPQPISDSLPDNSPDDDHSINIDETRLDELNATLGQAHIKELLQIYLTELNTRSETIKQAIINPDLTLLSREGHTIKSSSATFGITLLQALGKELEACGYNNDLPNALIIAEKLLSCAAATIKVLSLRL